MVNRMKNCEVSVIVPVYNVEDYIDDCIESIVRQTFSDIEILMILGHSTDGTSIHCEKWIQKDDRIRGIQEEERGLGPARNQGIREARGKYIVFVDSDDVIRPDYIEKMYNVMLKESADLVECDFCKIRLYSEKDEYISCTSMLNKEFDIYHRLLLGNVAMWKIMTSRRLWLDHNIVQPHGAAEDFFTYPILLFSANKISCISEDLYLYRKDRLGNMCSSIDRRYFEIAKTLKMFLEMCIDRGYIFKYKYEINMYILRWISRYLSPCLGKVNYTEYIKIKHEYTSAYISYFSDRSIVNEVIWGGFNLNRIINKLDMLEDPYCRFNFISIISVMSNKVRKFEVKNKNPYREFMLKREYQDNFFDFVKKNDTKFFFFDLLEERHDIIEVEQGTYITKSDAFEEADINLKSIKVIRRDTEECRKIWEESCIRFIGILLTLVKPQNIFMVKNFLMEQYGDGTKKSYFKNINEIKKTNDILDKYYHFIESEFPDIRVVDVNRENMYYYTDVKYEFGCFPWHMNEWANIQIAECISKFISEKR